jgi:hypothetical protein
MFRPTLSNPSQQRTLRPLYANTQATPWAGFLDPSWNRAFDIYPGTVMTRKSGEVFVPYTGAANQKPFGLSALFVAPVLGIDEVTESGTNNFTVWVGGDQALFEVLAPAFDQTALWNESGNGQFTMLTATNTGLLTPTGVTEKNAIAELVKVVSTDKILVRLNRYDIAANTAPAGGS